jgi:glycerophosphoryl diester phosphodiesterase
MKSPLVIGHRGASAHAPENTMSAFRMAMEAGADGIEFDVRLSRDGIPFVIHDDNLRRTGLDPRRVADVDASELIQIDAGRWFDSIAFANERLPMLKDVLDLFGDTTGLLYLEMKSTGAEREKLAAACCELLNSSSLKDRVIVECFDLPSIELLKQIDPTIKTAALFQLRICRPASLDGHRLVKDALAVSANEIALHHRLADPKTIALAKQEGLKVVVWTVDDPSWIQRAMSDAIDALITNEPKRLVCERDAVTQGQLKRQQAFAYIGDNDPAASFD